MAYPQGQPIVMQPGALPPQPPGVPGPPMGPQAAGWMQSPESPPPNCPPGLEYLSMIDQLLIKQKVEMLEAFTGFETNNKYEIVNSVGQRVYYAAEDTNCCTRNCCGAGRPFNMNILDNTGRTVMKLDRPLRCGGWCCCCLHKVEVEAPPGVVVGYVRQQCSPCYPRFSIRNAADDTVLKISGPCCTWSICGDVEFDVQSKDGTRVGRITKQWSGLTKEYFTDADNFGISFPMDLDVNIKAVMLGAVFLIDFMFFEQGTKKGGKHHHHH